MGILVNLNEEDWIEVLAILEVSKKEVDSKEKALEIQRIVTAIKQQVV